MKIESVFKQNEAVPLPYTCLGRNISPPLEFREVPEGAESLVLIVEDVDASPWPWIHWMLFNIPAITVSVDEGKLPDGAIEGLANNHSFGYEGPCPKYFQGTHHYHFRLFALDRRLDLPPASEPEEVVQAMQGHVLAEAVLVGTCIGTKQENI